MTARITQGTTLVGVRHDAPARITQVAVLVGVRHDAPARITQVAVLVGVKYKDPACLTDKVQCWRIERTDGTVLRYTAHDMPITINAEEYSPCASLRASALQRSSEFQSTENMDLEGMISDGAISRADLWAGKYDGAQVQVWEASWSGAFPARILAEGLAGGAEFGTNEFKLEMVTASERLQQRPILQPVMPTCRFKLGDARCGVDLEALRVNGTVSGILTTNLFTGSQLRVFDDSGRSEVDTYFALGGVTWVTGDNAGVTSQVKSFDGERFVLEQPLQYPIQVGDTYTAVPGCDRVFATCDDKFSNAIGFGGFPHLRGPDDLAQVPDVTTE
jgi:uncharacterized phage protein (TIGR02218 family)